MQRSAVPAALAWLAHPITCVALVLLALNDRVLKATSGTWWTGKLSDVAWLVVVPPLVAVALAGASTAGAGRPLPARACTRTSLAVVGTLFVVVKSTTAGAAAGSAVLTAVAGPSSVLPDPSDLLTLPALAVAWCTARATGAQPSRDDHRDLRWVLVLPLVVLATAATSSVPRDGARDIALVDGTVVVNDSRGGTWYVTEDGSRWTAVDEDDDDALDRRFAATDAAPDEACAPAPSTECFRAAGTGIGVDRSDDGRTWETEWAIPDELLPRLAARYEPTGERLQTHGVAVLPTPDGFRVIAANGGDGVAVRDEGGTWTRIGFTYTSDGTPVVPLPGEPTTMAYPVPVALMLAVPAASVTLALSALRRRRTGNRPARPLGWVLLAAVAVLSVVGVRVNDASAVVSGQEIGTSLVLGSLLVPAAVVCLLLASATLLAVAATILRGGRAAWLVAATGTGVALVAGLVAPTTLAAVTAAALVGAGAVGTARLAADPRS